MGSIKYHKKYLVQKEPIAQNSIEQLPLAPIPETPKFPESPNITTKIPTYLDYSQIITQFKEWTSQAKDVSEIGTYGKSANGTDLYYLRINNNFDKKDKPKVLITACIHGNEPHATGVVMGYAGSLLGEYGKNQEITDLINNRDIYIVPVISPDSYPFSRAVNGVDPNRNFPGPSNPNKQSVPPVKAIQDFVIKIKPNAVISGHTWGRVFLTPYGDKNDYCPDHDEYKRIIGKMADLCQYGMKRACEMYGTPIHGTEVDWYYRHGAFSSSQNGEIHSGAFSIVMEMGTHQRIPTKAEIEDEFNRTFRAVLYFIKEAPLVEIWWDKNGNPVNRDGTPKKIALRTTAGDYTTVCKERSTSRFTMTDMGLSDSEMYPSIVTGPLMDSRLGLKSLFSTVMFRERRDLWSMGSTPSGSMTYLPKTDSRRLALPAH